MEETIQAFGMRFAKLLFLKTGYAYPSKVVAVWTFYISILVNTTARAVNSYTVLYMCMEVIICHSDRFTLR